MEMQVINENDVTRFDDDNYGFQDDNYTGFGDDQLDFGGEGLSFATENASGRTYVINITNTLSTVERVGLGSIIKSMIPNTTTLKEGALKAGLICNGSTDYDSFREFCKLNPTRVTTAKMQSGSEAQLGQMVQVARYSPFENLGSKPVPLAAFTDEKNLNAKMVTLRGLNWQLDNQTEIAIDVVPNSILTLTLFIGAISNSSKSCNNKYNKARIALSNS